ncbi:hypothetical protein AB0K00_22730 [Dactylosporangium sp. NPDC049525]|uniref:vWA-MoxR associated conflict system protein n=1 Tax=Dactylosporangium sp. NPDC049525 TaxID=3154730 RepID=UPI00343D7018
MGAPGNELPVAGRRRRAGCRSARVGPAMIGLRHCLVVAVDYDGKLRLARLARAAQDLAAVLRDPHIGACDPGLPDGRALVDGKLTKQDVDGHITTAIEFAGVRRATLIIALLGHGFVVEGRSRLYYMAHDSAEHVRNRAVNVPEHLSVAADHPGVNGVLGLVDTCMAAGAVPDAGDLIAGVRSGQTRLQLLLAAGVVQQAVDLRMTTSLVEVLKFGLPIDKDVLAIPDVHGSLRGTVTGQSVGSFAYDGAPGSAEHLWLAHNRRYSRRNVSDGLIGAIGAEQLATARAILLPDQPAGVGSLMELRRAAETTTIETPATVRARRLVDTLSATERTAAFVRRWLPAAPTTVVFRRALVALDRQGIPPAASSPHAPFTSEIDYIEHVAFARSGLDGDYRAGLVAFVAALADELRMDLDVLELAKWAAELNANLQLGDALRSLRAEQDRRALRLVVRLPGPTESWPDTVMASLHEDGQPPARWVITCAGDRAGADEALHKAIHWAEKLAAERRRRLWHIDVVAPAGILLTWHPEDAERIVRLGLLYDFRMHWNWRTDHDGRAVNLLAVQWLDSIASTTDEQVMEWLPSKVLQDGPALRSKLVNQQHNGALGLEHHPGSDVALAELLLTHAPIVMWPRESTDTIDGKVRQHVADNWQRLPDEFGHAYRRWRRTGGTEPLVAVRAVWEDSDWLDLCSVFQR